MVQWESAKKRTTSTGKPLAAVISKDAKCNKAVKVKDPGTKPCPKGKVVYVSADKAKSMGVKEDEFLSEKDIEEHKKNLRKK